MSAALIAAHALGASLALTLGGWQLLRRARGDRAHRLVGRVWVVAMYWAVLSSFFIKQLDPGHFSWIHGLSAFTFLTLSLGTWAAIRGRIGLHRHFMRGSYLGLIGAFLGAVVVPQRDIPQLLVHRPVVLAATAAAVSIATVTVIAVCTGHPGRRAVLPLPDPAPAPLTGARRRAPAGDPAAGPGLSGAWSPPAGPPRSAGRRR